MRPHCVCQQLLLPIMPSCTMPLCHHARCHYAIMHDSIMPSWTKPLCHSARCHYAIMHDAIMPSCTMPLCHHARCHYAIMHDAIIQHARCRAACVNALFYTIVKWLHALNRHIVVVYTIEYCKCVCKYLYALSACRMPLDDWFFTYVLHELGRQCQGCVNLDGHQHAATHEYWL